MTFEELNEKCREILSKQKATTLEQARAQVKWLKMASVDKKRKKLEARIAELELNMFTNLKQKTSSTAEINISKFQNEINRLRIELKKLS